MNININITNEEDIKYLNNIKNIDKLNEILLTSISIGLKSIQLS